VSKREYIVLLGFDPEVRMWVTLVPALPLSTYGKTQAEALEQTREAILGYIEAAIQEGLPIPPSDVEQRRVAETPDQLLAGPYSIAREMLELTSQSTQVTHVEVAVP
jgi:predicted RNase H-like HicB family nuclease